MTRRAAYSFLAAAVVVSARPADAQVAKTQAPAVSMPKWQGPLFLDGPVRAWLRATTSAARKTADDASSVLLYGMAVAPFAASIANVVSRRGTLLDAAGLGLVDAEALGVAVGTTFLLKNLVGRERPYATAERLSTFCVDHPTDSQCGSDRNASFFSGHSAVAFASAGLVCMQQLVFGARGADALVCGSAFGLAAATAALRIVADMHYATDTAVGAGIGLLAGMLLPYVLHFAPWAPFPIARSLHALPEPRPHRPFVDFQLMPWAGPGGGGLTIGARF